jgi:hypothetical protein
MMVYRSLVVGLLGAIALLVASRPAPALVAVETPVEVVAAEAPATVVDVSRAIAGDDPVPLLGLAPGERVIEVDGAVGDTGALVRRWVSVVPGEYVDVGVAGGGGVRRVLVLVHA